MLLFYQKIKNGSAKGRQSFCTCAGDSTTYTTENSAPQY